MRHALAYVLNNALRHRVRNVAYPDVYSSGEWFEGWEEHAGAVPTLGDTIVLARARSWLQRVGWWERGGGFLSLHTVPGPEAVAAIPYPTDQLVPCGPSITSTPAPAS